MATSEPENSNYSDCSMTMQATASSTFFLLLIGTYEPWKGVEPMTMQARARTTFLLFFIGT